MVVLNSSAIRNADYDALSQELYITFTSGLSYTYLGVPEWKFAEFQAAQSAGQYFNDHIRDHSSSR